ncbi:MAG TPA: HD domain-containing protein [Firmicutes bacterium]|jgi:uncharacterized protein|nr:HD domain-containing protein [Bacillota bacterium]
MNEVEATLRFLFDQFEKNTYYDEHPEAKAYRLEHSFRVAKIGRTIAESEGFHVEGMVIACLLHDVSYGEGLNGEEAWLNHGRRAAEIARPLLETLDLPSHVVKDILYGIAMHVDDEAGFPGTRTPFAETVGAADNIDRFDVYRLCETLQNARFNELPLGKKQAYCEKRLLRLPQLMEMDMGTATGNQLWKERLSFQIEYFQRLSAQLAASSWS